ncbi:Stage III sporulation protein AB (spore_III_AB) [Acididesulfobacillus acetoxydans]|uniref:Stage III sporulation protein AB (Spore_III_AB) n=1 Tax=Acididesulfobacillus acetoxydans TaxID=1561005 RepID=A0A8S0W8W2_9FIRM|nr:stage III sporulation protein AB [Acididesulfobacillus acetoxydans]CAA7602139.1 Stage III sporulation protein AB (spore_III_AB) [Acididesulfobacillus acetoxydans]CEJ08018.1 Stage III sporulation protein AB (spore_III_AB) [Acididesulfobacillus acetoxydans]
MLILGAMGLIAAFGGIGLWLAARVRRRPEEIRVLLTALALLDTDIYWGATPLPEAFSGIADRVEDPWRNFFTEVKERIERGEAAWPAWKETIARLTGAFALKPEDWLIVLDIGKGLGRSDQQEQHKQLELAQKQLTLLREQAVVWAEKQAKMWAYLGFLVGCAGAIFLI